MEATLQVGADAADGDNVDAPAAVDDRVSERQGVEEVENGAAARGLGNEATGRCETGFLGGREN
jgi:hypothetical protein